MLEQERDLREEGDELYELLKTLDESDWERPTPFKSWTVRDVVEHLHFSDRLAVQSLRSGEEFLKTAADMVRAATDEGLDLRTYARRTIGSRSASELLQLWRECFLEMCDLLDAADPNARLSLEVPPDIPYVRLTAPSGEIWEWNEPNQDNRVEGLAAEFCHVVTQGRNISDTHLEVVGETATRWMAIAQCFAGGPEDPPKPGERT
jgi:hypothetical protein